VPARLASGGRGQVVLVVEAHGLASMVFRLTTPYLRHLQPGVIRGVGADASRPRRGVTHVFLSFSETRSRASYVWWRLGFGRCYLCMCAAHTASRRGPAGCCGCRRRIFYFPFPFRGLSTQRHCRDVTQGRSEIRITRAAAIR
jgi:hypothetical protein